MQYLSGGRGVATPRCCSSGLECDLTVTGSVSVPNALRNDVHFTVRVSPAVPTPLAIRSSDAFQPTGTNMAAKMKPREAVHRRQMVCPITYVRTTCKPILEINALPDTRVVASADVCCEGGHSLSNASPHPIPPHTFLAPPVRVIPFEVI